MKHPNVPKHPKPFAGSFGSLGVSGHALHVLADLTDEQKAASVALLFHGHTERAVEARKEKLIPGARTRRVETDTTSKPAHRTHEKVQKEAGVSQHKARQALRVVEASPERCTDQEVSGVSGVPVRASRRGCSASLPTPAARASRQPRISLSALEAMRTNDRNLELFK